MHRLLLRLKSKRLKKIKVYMYANNQCIKKIKVLENEKIFDNTFVIRVFGKKYMFGSNYVKIIVKPVAMLKNFNKEVHITIDYERGVKF